MARVICNGNDVAEFSFGRLQPMVAHATNETEKVVFHNATQHLLAIVSVTEVKNLTNGWEI